MVNLSDARKNGRTGWSEERKCALLNIENFKLYLTDFLLYYHSRDLY